MLGQMLPEITFSLYGLTFLEGILAFVSPCILPLLPVYLMYLSGNQGVSGQRKRLIINTIGFIFGFTLVFVTMGATASALGGLVADNRMLLQRLAGAIMIFFGLNYIGWFNLSLFNRGGMLRMDQQKKLKFFSSVFFGVAFSLGWTPCLTAFLGSALLLASNTGTLYHGIALLFVFSLGLGIPFLVTALLWNQLQGTIGWIKRNYGVIKGVSGGLLIVIGLLMVFNLFDYYGSLFL